MSVIESILYGLISGITEFLPISSGAHQVLLRYLFGVDTRVPVQELLVHIGVLLAIFVGCKDIIFRLRIEQKMLSNSRRRRHSLDSKSYFDLRLLKTASTPLLVGLLLTIATFRKENNIGMLIAFSLINAAVLLFADHTSRGNRDSRTMSGLDGIVMGVAGALSVFPGVSRTGMISAYTAARGAEVEHVVNWTVLLGIPAMLFALCFDLVLLITMGFMGMSFVMFLGYVLSGVMAFVGGYLGISLLKIVLNQNGFSGFAYYSIGMALFSFILYLIT